MITNRVIYTNVDVDKDGRIPTGHSVMQIREFQESGLLMEINRVLLHPLGLALMLVYPIDLAEQEEVKDGYVVQMGIIDSRDDPEGMIFAEIKESDVERLTKLRSEFEMRCLYRDGTLGYSIQPIKATEPE